MKVPWFIHLLDMFIDKCYNLIGFFVNRCRQNTAITFNLLLSNRMKYVPNMMFIKDKILSKLSNPIFKNYSHTSPKGHQ